MEFDDDVLINCLQFLFVEEIFNCLSVNSRWNQIGKYVINTMKKDCYFSKWRTNHLKLLQNTTAEIKHKTSNYRSIDLILEQEGIGIFWDSFVEKYFVEKSFVEFQSAFKACVRFILLESDKFFPQQSEPHYLPKSGLIIFHVGFHDENTDEIEYHFDIVFDVSDWSNIKRTTHPITSSFPHINGRCQMCKRWNTHDDILPVGTIHHIGNYGRNIFSTPNVMVNQPDFLRTYFISDMIGGDMINIFENGDLVNQIPKHWQTCVTCVDCENLMISTYNLQPSETYFVNVKTSAKSESIKTFDYYGRFCKTGNQIYFGTCNDWRKVLYQSQQWIPDDLIPSPNGVLPVFCPHEQRLLFFQRI